MVCVQSYQQCTRFNSVSEPGWALAKACQEHPNFKVRVLITREVASAAFAAPETTAAAVGQRNRIATSAAVIVQKVRVALRGFVVLDGDLKAQARA